MSNAEPASVGDLLQVVSAAAAESSPPLALRRLIPPGATAETMQTQPAAAGVMVRSQIIKANGEPVNVDYMMRRKGDSWLISDVYLDGAISEVATRRSEFAAILKSQGIDGLIAALNRKADILTATTAKAS